MRRRGNCEGTRKAPLLTSGSRIYAITVTHVKIANRLGDEVPDAVSNFVTLHTDNETRTIEHLGIRNG